MQQSNNMPKNKESQPNSETEREPFPTFDDVVERVNEAQGKINEAVAILTRMGDFKHPLDVRKGRVLGKEVEESMSEERESRQIKGAGRTYFLDVEKTSQGKPYLRITESKKGEGDKFERNSILVFPEDAADFSDAVTTMLDRLAA